MLQGLLSASVKGLSRIVYVVLERLKKGSRASYGHHSSIGWLDRLCLGFGV